MHKHFGRKRGEQDNPKGETSKLKDVDRSKDDKEGIGDNDDDIINEIDKANRDALRQKQGR
jgi:hypothetical protein